jgi:hypothetical protein
VNDVLHDNVDFRESEWALIVVVESVTVAVAVGVLLDAERVQELVEIVGEKSKDAADEPWSWSRCSDNATGQKSGTKSSGELHFQKVQERM